MIGFRGTRKGTGVSAGKFARTVQEIAESAGQKNLDP
jgi:hypothetical protein